MTKQPDPPSTSAAFDAAYESGADTMWSDDTIPAELCEIIATVRPARSLEFGCGLGTFSRYLASEGIVATAVDFSLNAIEKARMLTSGDARQPTFLVGDVTDLAMLTGPFDLSFDVGCFHCLDAMQQQKYAAEAYRLLTPGSLHLMWALNEAPTGIEISPTTIERVFCTDDRFTLVNAGTSSRRSTEYNSHWYWLARRSLT